MLITNSETAIAAIVRTAIANYKIKVVVSLSPYPHLLKSANSRLVLLTDMLTKVLRSVSFVPAPYTLLGKITYDFLDTNATMHSAISWKEMLDKYTIIKGEPKLTLLKALESKFISAYQTLEAERILYA